jgi:hypothetical protein
MANGERDPAREARWRGLLAAQRKCGLSVRAFWAREQVTEPSFYAWRREIGVRDGEKTRPAVAKRRTPAFVPLLMPGMAAASDGHVVIELRGGRVLRLPPGLPTARVTELVRAVEAAS